MHTLPHHYKGTSNRFCWIMNGSGHEGNPHVEHSYTVRATIDIRVLISMVQRVGRVIASKYFQVIHTFPSFEVGHSKQHLKITCLSQFGLYARIVCQVSFWIYWIWIWILDVICAANINTPLKTAKSLIMDYEIQSLHRHPPRMREFFFERQMPCTVLYPTVFWVNHAVSPPP